MLFNLSFRTEFIYIFNNNYLLKKYNFCFLINLNIYEKTSKIFSPLKPMKLNNKMGKHKIIVKNILIVKLEKNKFKIDIIVVIHIILNIAVV